MKQRKGLRAGGIGTYQLTRLYWHVRQKWIVLYGSLIEMPSYCMIQIYTSGEKLKAAITKLCSWRPSRKGDMQIIIQGQAELSAPTAAAPQPEGKGRWLQVMASVWEKLAPAALVILTPALFLLRLVLTAWLWIRVYLMRGYIRVFLDRRISNRQKCPACGIRQKHKIKWDPDYECVMHFCGHCEAKFPTPPVQNINTWRVGTTFAEKPERRMQPPQPKDPGWMDTISEGPNHHRLV